MALSPEAPAQCPAAGGCGCSGPQGQCGDGKVRVWAWRSGLPPAPSLPPPPGARSPAKLRVTVPEACPVPPHNTPQLSQASCRCCIPSPSAWPSPGDSTRWAASPVVPLRLGRRLPAPWAGHTLGCPVSSPRLPVGLRVPGSDAHAAWSLAGSCLSALINPKKQEEQAARD